MHSWNASNIGHSQVLSLFLFRQQVLSNKSKYLLCYLKQAELSLGSVFMQVCGSCVHMRTRFIDVDQQEFHELGSEF